MLPILCFPFKTLMVLCVKLQSETMLPILCVPFKNCVSDYSLQPCFLFFVSPLKHWWYWGSNYSLKPCVLFFVSPLKHWWCWGSNYSLKPCFPFFFVCFFSWYFTASLWKTWVAFLWQGCSSCKSSAAHSYQRVQYIQCPNNGMAASVWDFKRAQVLVGGRMW